MYAGNREVLSFYSSHSSTSDPGVYASALDCLPAQVAALARSANGIVRHFLNEGGRNSHLYSEHARGIEYILERVLELNRTLWSEDRRQDEQYTDSGHDHSLLLLSMLRHQGTPARIRCGFARYVKQEMHPSRWICEYWDAWSQRWVMVDAAVMGADGRAGHEIAFNPLDVPHTQFLTAGKVWQMCRIWGANPSRFGSPDAGRGLSIVATNLAHDFACLNKEETAAWDDRQFSHATHTSHMGSDPGLLDRVAALTLAGNKSFGEMRALYEIELRGQLSPAIHKFERNVLHVEELAAYRPVA